MMSNTVRGGTHESLMTIYARGDRVDTTEFEPFIMYKCSPRFKYHIKY